MADPHSILRALAREQAAQLNSSAFSQGVNKDLTDLGSSIAAALMAPGNALRGQYSAVEVNPDYSVNPVSQALMDQAANMAGVVSLGSMPMSRPTGSLGMGGKISSTKEYPMAPRSEWYSDGNYQSAGGVIRYMTPDEYLARVRPLKLDEESLENIEDLKSHIASGRTLDPLKIYAGGKEDGRHRAYAAKALGIDLVPVIEYGDQIGK